MNYNCLWHNMFSRRLLLLWNWFLQVSYFFLCPHQKYQSIIDKNKINGNNCYFTKEIEEKKRICNEVLNLLLFIIMGQFYCWSIFSVKNINNILAPACCFQWNNFLCDLFCCNHEHTDTHTQTCEKSNDIIVFSSSRMNV